MNNGADNTCIIKLRSTSNEIELAMIREILEEHNIPYIVKDYGLGGYMRIISGISLLDTDIMVEQGDFDKANSLLESIGID